MKERECACTLVILAAGRGRRFGGIKQLEPVGPNGEILTSLTIRDAIAAGVSAIVIVTQPELECELRQRILDESAPSVSLQFIHQARREPSPESGNGERPWGTAHAILTTGALVRQPFVVVNADDYYGPVALGQAISEAKTIRPGDSGGALVSFLLRNTVSPHGGVSRGVCEIDRKGQLRSIRELHDIRRSPDGTIVAGSKNVRLILTGEEQVSMNLWVLPEAVFPLLNEQFQGYLNSTEGNHREFELPTAIGRMIDDGQLRIRVLGTDARWCGLTYRADLPALRERLLRANRVS